MGNRACNLVADSGMSHLDWSLICSLRTVLAHKKWFFLFISRRQASILEWRTQLFLNFQFVGSLIQEALPAFQGSVAFLDWVFFWKISPSQIRVAFLTMIVFISSSVPIAYRFYYGIRTWTWELPIIRYLIWWQTGVTLVSFLCCADGEFDPFCRCWSADCELIRDTKIWNQLWWIFVE
jgi:hypothetical protein